MVKCSPYLEVHLCEVLFHASITGHFGPQPLFMQVIVELPGVGRGYLTLQAWSCIPDVAMHHNPQ